MVRRVIRGLVVLALMVSGITVAEAPAMAATGTQCNTANPNVHVCVYGKNGSNNCTAWLSLKVSPTESIHHYGLIMEINYKATQVASGVFTKATNYPYPAAARICHSSSLTGYHVRSCAYIYTAIGILHYNICSPYVDFVN
ncbi:hypothetical protein Rhe02_52780 [Rhizocola hellebori]|uniref:Uncharacterized protein n=1 Tax=Rhizocola hellebori TaxID=1392758 RepID=A0A8J3VIM5_9ACTN|nr:hypothetical protein [Rhizocola hellebori]GIH07211.1 hypothetical protein Rhe02_52780 [Rhizocola hellebori]